MFWLVADRILFRTEICTYTLDSSQCDLYIINSEFDLQHDKHYNFIFIKIYNIINVPKQEFENSHFSKYNLADT